MWGEWTQITLQDSVFFSIFAVAILYLVGSGILGLICILTKKVNPFSSFDVFQKANFQILFGFIFAFLFILILSIAPIPFLASSFLILSISIIALIIVRCYSKNKLPRINKTFIINNFDVIIVLAILLSLVFITSTLITGFYGATNDDGADHTLMIRIILDNPNALLTRSGQPYVSFKLNYPSGVHVLCAIFVTLLGIPVQKIVLLLSAILPCLIALAFYSTIKCLFESKALSIVSLIIASFFTLGLSWVPISWSGLPVLLSFYLSISGMGLIYTFLLKQKMTWLNASLIGFIIFIALQTYPSALLMMLFWVLMLLSFKIANFQGIRNITPSISTFFNRRNLFLIIAFLTPLLFGVPYIFSYYMNNIAGKFATGITLNSVTNISSEFVKTRIGFDWIFDIPALWLFFSEFGKLLALASFSLILLIVLFIPYVSKRIASVFPSKEFKYSLLLVYLFMLLIMGYLTLTLYLPINLLSNLFDPARVWQHIFIPATILTAVVLFSAIYFFSVALRRLFNSGNKTNRVIRKNKILACALLVLLVSTAGVFMVPVIVEQQAQYSKMQLLFNTYQSLGVADVSLLKWISENIPSNGRILVSAGDSGQFVTSVTQRQTVSMYSYLRNYSDLMSFLTADASDLRAVPFLIEYNVSYVYIGSIATTYALNLPYYRHFNASQFLVTPYFTVIKQVGDAWLFQFNETTALNTYMPVNEALN
ncbi:MAG: hypothetical protein NWE98_06905 [Candidatus Bathyarchaeota archaeon]|nr:hypothetical protein [Candidatus Bathyarchaeota archaeon]